MFVLFIWLLSFLTILKADRFNQQYMVKLTLNNLYKLFYGKPHFTDKSLLFWTNVILIFKVTIRKYTWFYLRV